MKKQMAGANLMYPMPIVLVGTTNNGKANFLTIAHVGIMSMNTISLGINRSHFSNQFIKQNGTFSVNIPGEDLVVEADHCGLVSGKDTDKSKVFKVFYGELQTAPLIEECPLNIECKLIKTVDFPQHEVFVGEIVQSYADDSVLRDGKIDYSKVRPFSFDLPTQGYWKLGERFAEGWKVGKKYRP